MNSTITGALLLLLCSCVIIGDAAPHHERNALSGGIQERVQTGRRKRDDSADSVLPHSEIVKRDTYLRNFQLGGHVNFRNGGTNQTVIPVQVAGPGSTATFGDGGSDPKCAAPTIPRGTVTPSVPIPVGGSYTVSCVDGYTLQVEDSGTVICSEISGAGELSALPTCEKGDLTGSNTIMNETLKTHNDYRTKHGADPLTWDKDVAKFAQAYCDVLAEKGVLEHSGDRRYGENLYQSWGLSVSGAGESATDYWYSEVQDYDYSNPGSSKGGVIDHFTQVVWMGSTKLGCGVSSEPSTLLGVESFTVCVCCNYSPPGNYIGQYKNNVAASHEKNGHSEGGPDDDDAEEDDADNDNGDDDDAEEDDADNDNGVDGEE